MVRLIYFQRTFFEIVRHLRAIRKRLKCMACLKIAVVERLSGIGFLMMLEEIR